MHEQRKAFFTPSQVSSRKPIGLVPQCAACQLDKQCLSPKMPVSGLGKKQILILAEAPGRTEDEQNRALCGTAGQYLEECLSRFGIVMREDCWLANSLSCRPKNNRKPTEKEVEYCRPLVIQHIKNLKPKLLILLGDTAVKSVLHWLWKDKVGGISRWMGWRIPSQQLNCWVCPTLHPSYVKRSEDKRTKRLDPILELYFNKHLEEACKRTYRPWGENGEKIPDYKKMVDVIMTPRQVKQMMGAVINMNKPTAFDFETEGLKPEQKNGYKLDIVSCAISNGALNFAYPWHGEAIEATKEFFLSSVPKIGANCFSGDTKFLTREYGIISLQEACGRSVTVLNHEGRWVDAAIHSFGQQETVETTFSRRNWLTTVRATDNHQWILANRPGRVETKDLRLTGWRWKGGNPEKGDWVPFQCAPKIISDKEDYEKGIRHGIILGDGDLFSKKYNTFRVRLCGHKSTLLPYFSGCRVSYFPSSGADPIVYVSKQLENLKKPPSDGHSDSYLIGFLRGLLATDGSVSQAGQVSVSNSPEVINWCIDNLPKVGYNFQCQSSSATYSSRPYSLTSTFKYRKICLTRYLTRESIQPDDLLLPKHNSRYKHTELGPYKLKCFGEKKKEEVFCAIVPDGNSFTLEHGLVTGNCKFENRFIMDRLGISVNNWIWDCCEAAHIGDNRPEISSVKFQSFVLLGQPSYNDAILPYFKTEGGGYGRNRIREANLESILRYNGTDALVEYKLAHAQAKNLGLDLASWLDG